MNTEQALKLLHEATRALQATRDQHQLIIQALETLKQAVEKKEA